MNIHHLDQIGIYCEDLDDSISVYQDVLGLEFVARFDPPGLGFFRIGDTRLLAEATARKATLYLMVDDIEAACQELEAKGVIIDSHPHAIYKDDEGLFGKPGAEEWMAFFRDPADNILALATQKS